ncbi:very short patch repair endonuclease [Belnapia moabensis]|uniref:very short patch repair endonuclease n=1 Tax=Belnapia moabensis TaxID=365533 RepID=UPI000A07A184|nr:very short patch repair endonuclease [Belnapia moabensis]
MGRKPFDDVDPARRRVMAAIRSKNTRPERLVRSALHAVGYRFRVHVSGLPGRPDIVFPQRKVAIFVHGCFWHQHPGCSLARLPRVRLDYWGPKLRRNMERDAANIGKLLDLGWRVHTVWECSLRGNLWMSNLRDVLGPQRMVRPASFPEPSEFAQITF